MTNIKGKNSGNDNGNGNVLEIITLKLKDVKINDQIAIILYRHMQ